MAGLAARLDLELGLDTMQNPCHAGQYMLTVQHQKILFCTVYDLDHRFSTMIGLPCVLYDQLKQEHLATVVLASSFQLLR